MPFWMIYAILVQWLDLLKKTQKSQGVFIPFWFYFIFYFILFILFLIAFYLLKLIVLIAAIECNYYSYCSDFSVSFWNARLQIKDALVSAFLAFKVWSAVTAKDPIYYLSTLS